jgi:heme/copper-type cytochrome/quinol oxidase subunit 1
MPDTIEVDEVFLAVFSVLGLLAALYALVQRVRDYLYRENERGAIVSLGRIRTHVLIVVLHTTLLAQCARLFTDRRPGADPWAILSIQGLPLVALAALLSTLNDLWIRYQVAQYDAHHPHQAPQGDPQG